VREVIYDRDSSGNYCDKPKEIVYYAPHTPGTKPRQFKFLAELGSYRKFIFLLEGTEPQYF
jgi:hypothetical protein